MARNPRGKLLLQLLAASAAGLVEQDRGIRLDPVAIIAAQQPRHRLTPSALPNRSHRAMSMPLIGVLDGAAAAEPEHRLPQFLAHALGLFAAFADEQRPQQLERTPRPAPGWYSS